MSGTSTIPPRGLPILSGPPPVVESSACRQCDKPFNPLWRRSHICGHCGYEYCSSCLSDGQALMPRKPGQPSSSSNPFTALKDELGIGKSSSSGVQGGSGYEVESVCLHCLAMLQVTAAPLPILRSLPVKRLKDYLKAYDIQCLGPKEKEDFVQAVIKARNPQTGCLSPEAESYYRRKSVPKHTSSENSNNTTNNHTHTNGTSRPRPQSQAQARPPQQTPQQNYYRQPQPQQQYRPPPPPQQYQRPPPQQQHYRPQQAHPPPPAQSRPTPPAARNPPSHPPPPVPTILSLVSLPKSYLSSLSIGTLKAILYENHVRVDFKQVLEKEELITRVDELITDERKRLERQRIEEERQANGEMTKPPTPPTGNPPNGTANGETNGGVSVADGGTDTGEKNVPTGPLPEIERGLCVVCQDEEATLAVVDCGHLAMCAHCSDLIMATSKECPLCRTRIVTPQRLIRIYRV